MTHTNNAKTHIVNLLVSNGACSFDNILAELLEQYGTIASDQLSRILYNDPDFNVEVVDGVHYWQFRDYF